MNFSSNQTTLPNRCSSLLNSPSQPGRSNSMFGRSGRNGSAPLSRGRRVRRESSEGVAGRMEDRYEKGHYRGVCIAGRSNTGTGWAERGSNARLLHEVMLHRASAGGLFVLTFSITSELEALT